MKIYVGEDSAVEQRLLRLLLDGLPDVRFFRDGLDLYREVCRETPTLVISDVLMPRLHGLALCKLIRGHQSLRGVLILTISSITDSDISQRALAAGADAFLPKPLDVQEFEAVVRHLLEQAMAPL